MMFRIFAIALIGLPQLALGQSACAPAQALHQARKSMASVDFPGFGSASQASLKTISMYEKSNGSNDIFYAGVVDTAKNKGWVLRYGGYDASVAWYGPINLEKIDLTGCEPAKSLEVNKMVSRWNGKK
jgi:hypothetical protein